MNSNFRASGVPLMGGINGSNYESSFVPTASFVCETDYSATWGPVFPSYFKNDGNIRGSHPKLEIYLHYSALNRKLTKVSVAIDIVYGFKS